MSSPGKKVAHREVLRLFASMTGRQANAFIYSAKSADWKHRLRNDPLYKLAGADGRTWLIGQAELLSVRAQVAATVFSAASTAEHRTNRQLILEIHRAAAFHGRHSRDVRRQDGLLLRRPEESPHPLVVLALGLGRRTYVSSQPSAMSEVVSYPGVLDDNAEYDAMLAKKAMTASFDKLSANPDHGQILRRNIEVHPWGYTVTTHRGYTDLAASARPADPTHPNTDSANVTWSTSRSFSRRAGVYQRETPPDFTLAKRRRSKTVLRDVAAWALIQYCTVEARGLQGLYSRTDLLTLPSFQGQFSTRKRIDRAVESIESLIQAATSRLPMS